MKRVLVTGSTSDSDWPEICRVTLPRMMQYANRHGMDFWNSELISYSRPPAWGKLFSILSAFERADEVLWLDADVFVCDESLSPFEEFPKEFEHACCRQFCSERGPHWNTGVWAVRRSAIGILSAAAMQDDLIHHPWWEQAAVNRVCEELRSEPWHLGDEWNHYWQTPDTVKPRFRHACGNHFSKLEKIRKWESECPL
jgi:hypothetical protein